MKREIDALTGRTFDVLVVGGGIYGLAVAYDAAQRGLDVALIERNDFGSGTSFNHLRTIHGGLRYLQTLDVRRARESLRERRTMAHIAPHMVRPLSFVLPLPRSLTRGKSAMCAAFALDRIVAFDRNRGVAPRHHLAAGRVVSRDEALARWPALGRAEAAGGLTGAAIWQDYVAIEADRLTLSFAIAAAEHGASLANHVEALAPLMDSGRVVGVSAVDRQRSRGLDISARVTVNATGAGVDRLRASFGSGGSGSGPAFRPGTSTASGQGAPIPMIKAMNLVTRREAGAEALGGRGASGRNLFMVPWRGRALFGTWESSRTCDSADTSVHEADVEAFIVELNEAFPALGLSREDVTLVHRGVVPAAVGADGRASLEGHDVVRDGNAGLISVAGTKYTTARAVAQRIVNVVIEKLHRTAAPCRTADTPLPGGNLHDPTLAAADAHRHAGSHLPSDVIAHLLSAYGSRYRDVVELAATRSEWCAKVADDWPVIGAQLVWAVREEMAATLADAMIRRTPLGALGYPGDAPSARAASIVGAELGWSDARMRDEVEDVKRFYGRPG